MCIQSGVAENSFLPGSLSQSSKNIFEGNRCLAFVPESVQSRLGRGGIARLGIPQQAEIIDIKDKRSRALSGFGDAVLRIFKTEELLDVAEANLQRPTKSKGF